MNRIACVVIVIASLAAPATAEPKKDSVRNGAVIGAIIGAIAAGTFATYVCTMLKEPGDPPCWRGVLGISAIGAGGGAAVGAGIDALHARSSPGVRFVWRHSF